MVDCHSHVLPSGDDGAANVEEGRALCVEAARRGTAVLFATPHVWPHLKLTPDREAGTRAMYQELRTRAGLDLRLGYELTPCPLLLRQDPHSFDGHDCGIARIDLAQTIEIEAHAVGVAILLGLSRQARECLGLVHGVSSIARVALLKSIQSPRL